LNLGLSTLAALLCLEAVALKAKGFSSAAAGCSVDAILTRRVRELGAVLGRSVLGAVGLGVLLLGSGLVRIVWGRAR
tara:strand:- start:314 stop:544 length:231 start_codon:yes stop_codon:yes gene_type:complete